MTVMTDFDSFRGFVIRHVSLSSSLIQFGVWSTGALSNTIRISSYYYACYDYTAEAETPESIATLLT